MTASLRITKERNHGIDGNSQSSLHARIDRAEAVDLRSPERCFRVPRPVDRTRRRGNILLCPRPRPGHDASCRQPCRLVVPQEPAASIPQRKKNPRKNRLRMRRSWVRFPVASIPSGSGATASEPPRRRPLVPFNGKVHRAVCHLSLSGRKTSQPGWQVTRLCPTKIGHSEQKLHSGDSGRVAPANRLFSSEYVFKRLPRESFRQLADVRWECFETETLLGIWFAY